MIRVLANGQTQIFEDMALDGNEMIEINTLHSKSDLYLPRMLML